MWKPKKVDSFAPLIVPPGGRRIKFMSISARAFWVGKYEWKGLKSCKPYRQESM